MIQLTRLQNTSSLQCWEFLCPSGYAFLTKRAADSFYEIFFQDSNLTGRDATAETFESAMRMIASKPQA